MRRQRKRTRRKRCCSKRLTTWFHASGSIGGSGSNYIRDMHSLRTRTDSRTNPHPLRCNPTQVMGDLRRHHRPSSLHRSRLLHNAGSEEHLRQAQAASDCSLQARSGQHRALHCWAGNGTDILSGMDACGFEYMHSTG